MSLAVHTLASGAGWQASDIVCSAGPQDRPFEEQHTAVSIAIVSEGTFQYRSSNGAALLGPGALLLGNPGRCFECGHEHAVGDRCLSFHFEPAYFERVVAAVPGARSAALAAPSLPAMPALLPLVAEAEIARDERDGAALEEIALRLAGAVVTTLAGSGAPARISRLDERRVTRALRRIEAAANEALTLEQLAADAATSPYHFLRVFRQIVGLTPHQYVLRTRLQRAAARLRRTHAPVAAIAFECGFNDLSTFNHRFRRVMGVSPTYYRRRADRALWPR